MQEEQEPPQKPQRIVAGCHAPCDAAEAEAQLLWLDRWVAWTLVACLGTEPHECTQPRHEEQV